MTSLIRLKRGHFILFPVIMAFPGTTFMNATNIPPDLNPDTVDNDINHRIVITFDKDTAWAASVFEVSVSDRVAHFSYYEVNEDSIVLWPDLFEAPGEYQIRVRASGYDEAHVTQVINEGGEWNNEILSLSPADNSFRVATDTSLTIEFRDEVSLNEGYIRIFMIEYETDSMLYELIPSLSDRVVGNGTKQITIDPENDFDSVASYFIRVDDNVFGNNFKGFNNDYDWNLSTYHRLDEILSAPGLGFDVRITVSLPGSYERGQTGYRGIFMLDAPYWKGWHNRIHEIYVNGDIPLDPVLVTIGPPWERDQLSFRELIYAANFEEFYSFMKNVMLPYVSSIYGIDPGTRMMVGASYGGFMSLYTFLQSCIEQENMYHDFVCGCPVFRNYSGLMNQISANTDSLGRNLAYFIGQNDQSDRLKVHDILNEWVEENNFKDFIYYDEEMPGKGHSDAIDPGFKACIPLLLNLPDPYFEFRSTSFCDTLTTPQPMLRSWPDDGILSGPGVSDNTFTPSIAGTGNHTLVYTYTSASGQEYSKEIEVVVDSCFIDATKSLGLRELSDIVIYPNPAGKSLYVETKALKKYNIRITSLNGQLLYCTKMEGPTLQIDLSSFQKGIYFITVRSRDQVRTEKIIKL